MSRAVPFDPSTFDFTQLFETSNGKGLIYRYYGYPRQRGSGAFTVLRTILKSKIFRNLARGAAGAVGDLVTSQAPAFASSPLGQQVSQTAANILTDIADKRDLGSSVKDNARKIVREMTGLGKKRKRRAPIAFIHRPSRTARVTL